VLTPDFDQIQSNDVVLVISGEVTGDAQGNIDEVSTQVHMGAYVYALERD
jgi:hypothetical protein